MNIMNITRCVLLNLSLLLVNNMPAMDNDPSQEELVVQAITHAHWGELALLDPSRTLINKVLIATKLVTGEVVKLAPLLHAVYTRNKDLVGNLLTHGAPPVGKLDTAEQLTTPLQEAIKLNDTQLITQLKNAWVALLPEARKKVTEYSAQYTENLENIRKKLPPYKKPTMAITPNNRDIRTEALQEISFANAVITSNIQELQRLNQLNPGLVDFASVRITLASGETVAVSPLLYAVHTQNIPLTQVLLELNAKPLGKFDSATQLSTPLQEAQKSENSIIIQMIRNSARKYYQKLLSGLIAMHESTIDPLNKNTHAIAHQVYGIDDQEIAQIVQNIHALKDQAALFTLCTAQEFDQFLDIEDLMATQNAMQIAGDIIGQGANEILERSGLGQEAVEIDRLTQLMRKSSINDNEKKQ
jgi:hypothetical protein